MIVYLAEVNSVFNLTLKEYNFFEAGEGKTQLDSHFAHISHKIIRWVRVGHDLETGEQLGDLIQVSFAFIVITNCLEKYARFSVSWRDHYLVVLVFVLSLETMRPRKN